MRGRSGGAAERAAGVLAEVRSVLISAISQRAPFTPGKVVVVGGGMARGSHLSSASAKNTISERAHVTFDCV